MPRRRRPPRYSRSTPLAPPQPSPPPPTPPPTPPSPSSYPNTLKLPLNWTESDCFLLSCHMYQNMADSNDSVAWWKKIARFFPGKTVQELRLFNHLYVKSYPELAADRGWISRTELDQLSEEQMIAGLPSLEESQTLRRLVEQNPDILTSKGAWKALAPHFPGKNTSEICRIVSMVRITALILGKLNANALRRRMIVTSFLESVIGDQQASTSGAKEDEEEEEEQVSDNEICIRQPLGEMDQDSAPSTSGLRSSFDASSRRRRGGRRRAGRFYRR